MYIFICGFLFISILCTIIFHSRRKKIICKICNMSCFYKRRLLNSVIEPFGFKYFLSQDVFTARINSLQREFGYTDLYDNAAPYFNMVYDAEPIYFNYQGYTWRIQLWKGQYGINIGSEIGLYRADCIVPPSKRAKAHFHSVLDEEMLPLSVELFEESTSRFYISTKHWWLSGFSMGRFSQPEKLWTKLAITFPNREMFYLFQKALLEAGYTEQEVYTYDLTVYIKFTSPHADYPSHRHPFRRRVSQIKNRFFCWLYLWATRPFRQTLDRMLLLYFFIPAVFRRMCKPRIYKKKGRL